MTSYVGVFSVRERVLFLFDNFELSGADRIAVDVARSLSERGVPIVLAVCMDVTVGFCDLPEELIRLSPPRANNEYLIRRIWRGMVALVRCIALAKTTSTIVCVTPPAAFVGLVASWVSGGNSIPWVHYDLAGVLREPLRTRGIARGLIQRLFYRYLVPLHRRLIFVSEISRQSMAAVARHGVVPAGWVVLPNIVNALDRAARAYESASYTRVAMLKAQGSRILLFIGRIARQKRWEDLVAAADLIDRQDTDYKLVIVGDGPEREELESAMSRSPSRNIVYLGADPNPMPVLAIADALVLTSLYEAWPTVILEAFQLGIPVISYDCPSGPGEMLGAGCERGWLVEETPTALALATQLYLGLGTDKSRKRLDDARDYASQFFPSMAAAHWQRYLEEVQVTMRDE